MDAKTKKESFAAGVLWMLGSATSLSIIGLLGKLIEKSIRLPALIFWRFFSAFVICLVILWCMGKLKGGFRTGNIKMHLLRTFFVLLAQYCFFSYIQQSTLLNAIVLLNTGPLFIPIIDRLILKKRVGRSTWVGVVVSFIGVLLILQPDTGIFSSMSLIGLMAGLSQGVSQIVFGISSRTERSEISVLYLIFLCAFFSLFPYLFLESSTWKENPVDRMQVIYWIIGLGAASVANQLFRAEAYQHGTPSRLASFLYFSVLLGGVFDFIIYGRVPNVLSAIGAVLVISGGVLKIYLRHLILKNK
jgi:drug/metabolite transporter (DMT)-like permease